MQGNNIIYYYNTGTYKRFGKSVEFKKYLHGICDAGSRLLFKFRSGTQGTFRLIYLPSVYAYPILHSDRVYLGMSVRM